MDSAPMAHAAHEEIARLIPWYINGTLSDAERRRVRGHLESCLPCRAELNFQRQVARAVRDADVENDMVTSQFANLLQQISATDSQPATGVGEVHTLDSGRRLPGKRALTNLTWLALAATLATAAAGLGLLRPALAPWSAIPTADYRTLSAPGVDAQVEAGEIVMAFQRDITDAVIEGIFAQYGIEPVAKSADQRLWWVRVTSVAGQHAELGAILTAMRQHEQILFAEQALPGE